MDGEASKRQHRRRIDMTVAAAQLLVQTLAIYVGVGAAFAAVFVVALGRTARLWRRNMAPGGSACWCVPVWRRCGRCLLSVSYVR